MIKVLTFKDFSKNTKKIHQHFSQEQTHQIFSNPNYLNLGIFNKSKLCGYMFLNISDQIDIIWIFVFPDFRKKGYATKMLNWLIKKYSRPIMIEVSQNNLAAINLYKNLGFKIINTRLNYYDNQAHALVMRYQALLKFKNKD